MSFHHPKDDKTTFWFSVSLCVRCDHILHIIQSRLSACQEFGCLYGTFSENRLGICSMLKLDAPSGTALALADSMNEALGNAYHYTYDRSDRREERDPKEIGISAVRGGNIVGEHEVIFAGTDEVIEFKHTAYSKAVFGKGAVEAAKFLAGKPAGRYEMSDVISAK